MGDLMKLSIRRAREADAPELGRICYEGFRSIAEAHNYPPDMPSAEHAMGLVSGMIPHPGFFSAVAEVNGRIAGSNFMDERGPIYGVGPITVDPDVQNDGVGQALMQAALDRFRERGAAGVRLVQSAYHRRSLALYCKLGFEVREPLACLQGRALGEAIPGSTVRAATLADLDACNRLCFDAHGHVRAGELSDAIEQGAAQLVERDGRVTGYATPIAFFGHAAAETNDDLKALMGASAAFPGPGVLVPLRNGELMRWCLARGLRIVQTMTLMSIGLYNEPSRAWLPSVLY
jgi:predicted N-acetyltransferase YhbS